MNGFDLSTISNLYVGSTQYSLIYKGSDLIWLSCPYDAEIGYLESNGSQWIDTGITPNSNTKVQFKFMNLAATGNVIIGYYTGDDTTDWRFFNYLNTAYFDVPSVGGGREGTRIYGGIISSNLDYELELGNYYVKNINSNLNIVSGSNQTFTGYSTITLNSCGVDNHNNSNNRWYYVKIYDGNTLVRDMIPVRIGLTGYMYDKISGNLLGNSGTGSFTLGPDINGGNISDYVQNGLVCHLDGINKGSNGDWEDLIGNVVFTRTGSDCYPTSTGYYVDGDYLTAGSVNLSGSNNYTVEVCYEENGSDQTYYLFGFSGPADSRIPLFYLENGRYMTWSQNATVYDGISMPQNLNYTVSLNDDSGLVNGDVVNKAAYTDYWNVSNYVTGYIGKGAHGGASTNPFKGTIYSIRIYNRKLTQAEQLLNLRVDNLRFGLGLSI